MAIVRQPGTTIDCVPECDRTKPPEEQTTFAIKVLTYDEWLRWVGLRMNNEEATWRAQKKLLGMGLVEVRNLQVLGAGGKLESFVLEKRGEELTEKSCSILRPFIEEIMRMIADAHTFKVDDAKN